MNKIEKGLQEAKEGKITPCSLEELKKDLYKSKWYDRLIYQIYYRPLNWITDLKWRIPNFFHRAWYGWGQADTWSLDFYLAKVIYQSLVHLKKYKHGYPIIIGKRNDTWKDKDYKDNEKAWDEIMDKMIYSFKLICEIGEGKREFYMKKLDKKYQKEYNCLTKEEDEKMKLGMKYFIEHYFCLND